MTRIYCRGVECPIKNTCLRYTGYNHINSCVGGYTLMRKCTNQKRYIQDENKINTDSKRR